MVHVAVSIYRHTYAATRAFQVKRCRANRAAPLAAIKVREAVLASQDQSLNASTTQCATQQQPYPLVPVRDMCREIRKRVAQEMLAGKASTCIIGLPLHTHPHALATGSNTCMIAISIDALTHYLLPERQGDCCLILCTPSHIMLLMQVCCYQLHLTVDSSMHCELC